MLPRLSPPARSPAFGSARDVAPDREREALQRISARVLGSGPGVGYGRAAKAGRPYLVDARADAEQRAEERRVSARLRQRAAAVEAATRRASSSPQRTTLDADSRRRSLPSGLGSPQGAAGHSIGAGHSGSGGRTSLAVSLYRAEIAARTAEVAQLRTEKRQLAIERKRLHALRALERTNASFAKLDLRLAPLPPDLLVWQQPPHQPHQPQPQPVEPVQPARGHGQEAEADLPLVETPPYARALAFEVGGEEVVEEAEGEATEARRLQETEARHAEAAGKASGAAPRLEAGVPALAAPAPAQAEVAATDEAGYGEEEWEADSDGPAADGTDTAGGHFAAPTGLPPGAASGGASARAREDGAALGAAELGSAPAAAVAISPARPAAEGSTERSGAAQGDALSLSGRAARWEGGEGAGSERVAAQATAADWRARELNAAFSPAVDTSGGYGGRTHQGSGAALAHGRLESRQA